MENPIQTRRYTVDRAAYLRTMYTYNLWKPIARIVAVGTVAIVAAMVFINPAAWGAFVSLAVFVPLLLGARYVNSRRNVYAADSRRIFDDPRTMTFTESDVHLQTESGTESRLPWANVVRIVRRGGFTLLFMGGISHFIVPDSAFATPDDFEAFLRLLGRHGL